MSYEQGWRRAREALRKKSEDEKKKEEKKQRLSGFRRLLNGLGTGIIMVLAAIAFCANAVQEAWYRLLDWWEATLQETKNALDSRAFEIIAMAFVIGMVLFAAVGCAGPLAEKGSLTQVGGHVRIVADIRIQTTDVCMASSTRECVEQIVTEVLGAPAPIVERLELKSGSSLSAAQGMAESVKMPDLGAYRVAEGTVELSWAYLTPAEERRVRDALAFLRPNPAPAAVFPKMVRKK